MSPNSASLAKKWGFKNLKVYVQGIPAWKKAGLMTTPDVSYIKHGNIILVDLRPASKISSGYIPKAYSIPFNTLEDSEDVFPEKFGAPIVLYSDNDADIKNAVKIIKEWGFKNLIPFYNAIEMWEQKGYELNTGPALTATEDNPIYYKKILGPGEISITDFKASLKSDLIFVLDARTPDEFASGHFPGAVNIPLEDLHKRMGDIPQDKFIIVHCKTGGRGEIGYRLLKGKGYAAKFLNAECECDLTGEFDIW
jgi:rhodanese-related sulfurtransferase